MWRYNFTDEIHIYQNIARKFNGFFRKTWSDVHFQREPNLVERLIICWSSIRNWRRRGQSGCQRVFVNFSKTDRNRSRPILSLLQRKNGTFHDHVQQTIRCFCRYPASRVSGRFHTFGLSGAKLSRDQGPTKTNNPTKSEKKHLHQFFEHKQKKWRQVTLKLCFLAVVFGTRTM